MNCFLSVHTLTHTHTHFKDTVNVFPKFYVAYIINRKLDLHRYRLNFCVRNANSHYFSKIQIYNVIDVWLSVFLDLFIRRGEKYNVRLNLKFLYEKPIHTYGI